jgi:hypothetical protein
MRNYQGTSKAMEADALVTMLDRAPEKNVYPYAPLFLTMIQMEGQKQSIQAMEGNCYRRQKNQDS